ncbi:c-type cytochrome biogenesis protein CcmI [Ferrovibrio sp.]|uniref:c-type cytochrome biogenesis protein CcmI n=1 Tax=Ferrovibrio sp. TaxID=1917215 RepID=UPI001B7A9F73|nr:c-type cytochrome biogenesis protein CcmI [Ferrovibrio sp.]MBP7064181.1 c-type cytochrome biogenesis protein CcmI [Ferrovibrio sp.]
MLWLGFALLLALALAFLLWPWFGNRRAANLRKAHDLAVYRAQLDEIAQEVTRGTLSETEANAARVEIQRRLLRADAAPDEVAFSDVLKPGVLLGTGLMLALLPVGAVGLYAALGRPDAAKQPVVAQSAELERQRAEQHEMDKLVDRLRQRLETEPNRAEGWVLLGRTLMNMGRYGEAVEAFDRLAVLTPEDAEAHAFLGEAYIFGNDGRVTREARLAFQRTLQLEPGHPSALYYLAMAKMQDGDMRGAFTDWLVLARAAEPDAPWLPLVLTRLREVAPRIGVDLAQMLPNAAQPANPPPPSGPTREQMEAAQSMSAEDRAAMIRGMVERLAERLKENPNDLEGWVRLGRAREVMNDQPAAIEAYTKALALMPQGIPLRAEVEGRLQALRR